MDTSKKLLIATIAMGSVALVLIYLYASALNEEGLKHAAQGESGPISNDPKLLGEYENLTRDVRVDWIRDLDNTRRSEQLKTLATTAQALAEPPTDPESVMLGVGASKQFIDHLDQYGGRFRAAPYLFTSLEGIEKLKGRNDIVVDAHTPLVDQRFLCGLGLGEFVPLNAKGGFLGRKHKPKTQDLLHCGHPKEADLKSPEAVIAKTAGGEMSSLKEAIDAAVEVPPDDRRAVIAHTLVQPTIPTPNQLIRLIGNPPPGRPSCRSARVSAYPRVYRKASERVLKLAAEIAALPNAKPIGTTGATTATIGMLAVADILRLDNVYTAYLHGDRRAFTQATEYAPVLFGNHLSCNAFWAWELGLKDVANKLANQAIAAKKNQDIPRALGVLALIAADDGDFEKASELAQESFEFRKGKGDTSPRMGSSVTLSLAFALKNGQVASLQSDVESWANPDLASTSATALAFALATEQEEAAEARQRASWALPKEVWTMTASLSVLSSLASGHEEAWLDTFQPPRNLMSYLYARQRVAKWRGDDDAASKWDQRISAFQEHLKDPKRAPFLDASH